MSLSSFRRFQPRKKLFSHSNTWCIRVRSSSATCFCLTFVILKKSGISWKTRFTNSNWISEFLLFHFFHFFVRIEFCTCTKQFPYIFSYFFFNFVECIYGFYLLSFIQCLYCLLLINCSLQYFRRCVGSPCSCHSIFRSFSIDSTDCGKILTLYTTTCFTFWFGLVCMYNQYQTILLYEMQFVRDNECVSCALNGFFYSSQIQ